MNKEQQQLIEELCTYIDNHGYTFGVIDFIKDIYCEHREPKPKKVSNDNRELLFFQGRTAMFERLLLDLADADKHEIYRSSNDNSIIMVQWHNGDEMTRVPIDVFKTMREKRYE